MNTDMTLDGERPLIAALADQSDETLRALMVRAKALLDAREAERRREALAQIRALARQHGLDVAVKPPARRRGRPPKSGES